jgi:HEAT repeat protein
MIDGNHSWSEVMNTIRMLILLFMLAFFPSNVLGQNQTPKKDSLADQIRVLDPKSEKAARLNAIQWLNRNTNEKDADLVVPALERCIREDPEGEVRQHAIRTLCQLVKKMKHPCPLAVVKAMYDPVDETRWEAAVWAGLFSSYAQGSTEILLRGAKSEKAELRSTSLSFLARAAPKDPKALEAMERAKKDKDLDVRHTAHTSMFKAKNNLEEHLQYVIRLYEDPGSILSPGPLDSDAANKERMLRNLYMVGTSMQVFELSERRADELAAGLVKLLDDNSAMKRRCAVNLIAGSAVKVELKTDRGPFDGPFGQSFPSLIPYTDPVDDPKQKKVENKVERLQKSKTFVCLEKVKIEERLRSMAEKDPDATVRDACKSALERLAKLSDKKP